MSMKVALRAGTCALSVAIATTASAQVAAPSAAQEQGTTSGPVSAPQEGASEVGSPNSSSAPTTTSQPEAGDIVVTAQRRSESVNSVPLSITALSGSTLTDRNIASTADLAKVVPGFSAQETGYDAPVYTLRGVGFFDYSLTAGSTVSVYTDEVALPFSVMTKAAGLDLARVEVLKGPQGTLYGQNATGGAINYIAAKPTDHFEAGLTGSFSRFNTGDVQGYVSGPIADDLTGRVALRTTQGGNWQKSYTRDDTLGAVHQTEGRVLLDWTPTSKLKVTLNANGWLDKSDTMAAQLYRIDLLNPAGNTILNTYPLAPHNDRAADWTPNTPFKRNDYFYQFALRSDYAVSSRVNLISITAYERYRDDSSVDFDGTNLPVDDVSKRGYISTVSQELRIQADLDNLKLIAGGNYEHDASSDELTYHLIDESNVPIIPPILIYQTANLIKNHISTYAAFGNADYKLGSHVTLHGGVRFTQSNRSFSGCLFDGYDGGLAKTFSILGSILTGNPPQALGVNQCLTFNQNLQPSEIVASLKEHNISWRSGVDYKLDGGGLLYVSVSKGYKAGSFPTLAASSYTQFTPVKQESLLSYEAGLKLPLAGRSLQFNAAGFYYDYRNKQVQGRDPDPVFGPLSALVNIPKSRVYGAEAQLVALPFRGLHISAAVTYLNTKILRFTGYDQDGVLRNFADTKVPFSPKWETAGDAQYDWRLSSRLGAFIGAGVTYNSSSFAQLGENLIYRIKPYALLDLRAGIKGPDDRWQVQIWGDNVSNTYYYSNVFRSFDTILRFPGKPATYGITASIKFQ